MPHDLIRLLRALIEAGYRVELRGAYSASYLAIIRNPLEQEVGDLEYRSVADEPNHWAQGLSYAGYVFDPQIVPDPALVLVQSALKEIHA